MDLFATDPPRFPHDGEHLHRSHAAPSLPRWLQLGGRESLVRPRCHELELKPPGLVLLLGGCPAARQPVRARPLCSRMGVQQGDLPEHHSHRGRLCEDALVLLCFNQLVFWGFFFLFITVQPIQLHGYTNCLSTKIIICDYLHS